MEAKEWTRSGRLPAVLILIARPMLVAVCSLMVDGAGVMQKDMK